MLISIIERPLLLFKIIVVNYIETTKSGLFNFPPDFARAVRANASLLESKLLG
jgi:hypothetical protein